MILPVKIEVQITDEVGNAKPLANVLLGLKVFSDNGSWHNYSFFKTNSEGQVCLTKQQIIDNTELKWGNHFESQTPTKFELYIWDGQSTSELIETTKRLLGIYNDEASIQKDLSRRGVGEDYLSDALKATREKSREDMALFEQIKDAVNGSVQVHTSRIEGIWLDDLPKQYKFAVA
jgi:hypothetical protein